MDSDGLPAKILIFFVFVIFDFIMIGFDSAVTAINEKERKKITEKSLQKESINQGKKRKNVYERLLQIAEDPSEYHNTITNIVIAMNLLNGYLCLGKFLENLPRAEVVKTAATYFSTEAFWVIAISSFTIFIFLILLLIIGVALPKRIALLHPSSFSLSLVGVVRLFMALFSPVTVLIKLLSGFLFKLFDLKRNEEPDVTEEEIISMVNEGHEQGVLEASEMEMINNIIEFGDKEAKDIMCNRTNIDGICKECSLQEAVDSMLGGNNSRYPVYDQDLDSIVGILYLKDAMRMLFHKKCGDLFIHEIDDLIRPAIFVPETKNIDEIFRIMQVEKTQIVIVIDEYGQTTGLITMEDILEEIVGNIMDEYDEADDFIEEKNENEFLIDGLTPLDELEDKFGIHFDTEEFDTLNGYLISKLEHIPVDGEEFSTDIGDYHFKILKVSDKVIQTVLVTKKENPLFYTDYEKK